MDAVLRGCSSLVNCDRTTIELREGWSISGLGGSNKTPWDTPREYSEEQLAAALDATMASVPDRARSIFNIHTPPYGSGLDTAEAIDSDFKVITKLGQTEMLAVGSSAVRSIIEKSRIPLALHGHVHDARGWKWIGETLCINPGSEYFAGVLDGCIVELEVGRVTHYQLTRG
jgi:Icc-related predicted phosphoesterase